MRTIVVIIIVLIGLLKILGLTPDTVQQSYRDEGIDYVSYAPANIQVIEYGRQAADSFKVPYYITRNCAKAETGFKGVFDFGYNPYQTSKDGFASEGPWQILYSTAKAVLPGQSFSRKELRTNIKLNATIHAKLFRSLYNSSCRGSWLVSASCYNQGVAGLNHINLYAKKVALY